MTTAFDPIDLSGKALANRIAMAPMTRSRADAPSATATALMATYYAQRASAGLIITEGIQPSPAGQGYTNTPGLHSPEQVESWQRVTDAVHARGGTIFAQLMHTGRISHPSLLPDSLSPVAPSAVAAMGQVVTYQGLQDYVTPKALSHDDITETIADYAAAARNAIAAGFDGVEIHGANGYLIHQFLAPNTNLRTDRWGGGARERVRFGIEVATAVAEAIGSNRTGFRISPGNPYNDIAETDPTDVLETYSGLIAGLAELDLAYLHLLESPDRDLTMHLRKNWPNTFILNPFTYPEPTGPDALADIENGTADIIAFGAMFLANPDLPARLAANGPFNSPDPVTFYGGDHRGYTDYPGLPHSA